MKPICTIIISFLFLQFSFAQTYEAGETYFGYKDYVEYKAGNLPIIISAAHGGSLEPSNIPDRNCSGCVYVKDSFTEELIREMYNSIFDEFGCYPHVIINRLHRRKLDANRAIGDAADGNAEAEQAWDDFQNFIELSKDTVEANFEKGLYLDLHGHGHEVQRLELGYLIFKAQLQWSAAELNTSTNINKSSIKNLVYNNLEQLTLKELLQGQNSFGQLFENENFPAVPSQVDPFPLSGESYFSGGYNTDRHGSKADGTIDAIQIECNMDGVRDTPTNRKDFAAAIAIVLKQYLEQHYFGTGQFNSGCIISNTETALHPAESIKVYPNPVDDLLNVELLETIHQPIRVSIYNVLGQVFFQHQYASINPIQLPTNHLPKGVFILKIETPTKKLITKFSK